MISEKKKKKKNQNQRTFRILVYFLPKINSVSFFFFSLRCVPAVVPPPITHGLEVTHGLKEIPPRDGESHPSLNRWLAVAIVDGLEVTHGQGCRSGGDPRPGLPPGVAVPDLCRSGGDPRPSLPPGVAVPTGFLFVASPSLSPALLKFLLVWLLLLEINLGGSWLFLVGSNN
jgi:hypothetical protein